MQTSDRLGARHLIGLVSALALYAFLVTSAAGSKSQTFDEIAYIAGGYTYWTLDDYRLHPENGNWTQRWIALPWLFERPSIPVPRYCQMLWTAA